MHMHYALVQHAHGQKNYSEEYDNTWRTISRRIRALRSFIYGHPKRPRRHAELIVEKTRHIIGSSVRCRAIDYTSNQSSTTPHLLPSTWSTSTQTIWPRPLRLNYVNIDRREPILGGRRCISHCPVCNVIDNGSGGTRKKTRRPLLTSSTRLVANTELPVQRDRCAPRRQTK